MLAVHGEFCSLEYTVFFKNRIEQKITLLSSIVESFLQLAEREAAQEHVTNIITYKNKY